MCPVAGSAGKCVRRCNHRSSDWHLPLVCPQHRFRWYKAGGSWFADDVHGKRFGAGLHDEFEPRRNEDGDVSVKLRCFPAGSDLSGAAHYVENILFALQPSRRSGITCLKATICQKISRLQNCSGLGRSEVVTASENVAENEGAVGVPGHGITPVADEHVDSPVLRISAGLISHRSGPIETISPGAWRCHRWFRCDLSGGWK